MCGGAPANCRSFHKLLLTHAKSRPGRSTLVHTTFFVQKLRRTPFAIRAPTQLDRFGRFGVSLKLSSDSLSVAVMFERFSSHSLASASPPQGPRSFSPAPRKPNNLTPSSLARPPFNARSSSLSLKSRQNSSTTSLLGAARNTNGSALKQELGASVEDPLDVLEQIVGLPRPLDEDNGPEETALERPAELVTNVPFGNLSLTDFVREKAPPNGQQRAETEHLSTQSAGECEYVDREKAKAPSELITG